MTIVAKVDNHYKIKAVVKLLPVSVKYPSGADIIFMKAQENGFDGDEREFWQGLGELDDVPTDYTALFLLNVN